MNQTAPTLLQQQMVDDVVLAYVQWREECVAVREAYGEWTSTTINDKPPADAAYWAALDREEAAAAFYANLVKRVQTAGAPLSLR